MRNTFSTKGRSFASLHVRSSSGRRQPECATIGTVTVRVGNVFQQALSTMIDTKYKPNTLLMKTTISISR